MFPVAPPWQFSQPSGPPSRDGTDSVPPAAYALYFDHRRRTQPDFRRRLRRNERRQARVEKEEVQQEGAKQRERIKAAVDAAKDEGFPTTVEDKEAYFLDQVSTGESTAMDRELARPPALVPPNPG